jgi:radical SAM protein with 4Fe4S-binding SPASM domain
VKRPACAGLWDTPMVHVNGDVTTCCLDEHLENKIGNLTEKSLDKIWNSELMNRWRLAHIEGRFEDSGSLCLRCNWRSAGGLSEDRAEEWLKKNQGEAKHLSKRKRLLYWLRGFSVSD